ncbi:MAG: ROK family transcriptional regulator [Pyrinomonadaceae bacterium]|nr:ROK family transcriptional regulator [Pyrinomonadaceae bacterium]
MNNSLLYRPELAGQLVSRKGNQLLRLIRAAQPITRTEIAERLSIDKSTVTENVKPLISRGLLRQDIIDGKERRRRVLSFTPENGYFIGVNLGVRRSQVGVTTLGSEISDESDFETPSKPETALRLARKRIDEIIHSRSGRLPKLIGVSVPGMVDAERQKLIFAPHLNWRDIEIAEILRPDRNVDVAVENDSTAAAMYEARLKIRDSDDGLMTNFILVRSGTGIGVGLVIGSQVYRGSGSIRGIAGEFGHMTIVAGGKHCVCGNRGCWEQYASAASAASLYLGDRPPARGVSKPRFVEIVSKAKVGDVRSRRTLEKIGDYLGIGIANVIMGIGISRVIISGRLVYGWEFIEEPLNAAIERSIIGKIDGWSVEAGEPVGSAIGGALEVAVEEYLSTL